MNKNQFEFVNLDKKQIQRIGHLLRVHFNQGVLIPTQPNMIFKVLANILPFIFQNQPILRSQFMFIIKQPIQLQKILKKTTPYFFENYFNQDKIKQIIVNGLNKVKLFENDILYQTAFSIYLRILLVEQCQLAKNFNAYVPDISLKLLIDKLKIPIRIYMINNELVIRLNQKVQDEITIVLENNCLYIFKGFQVKSNKVHFCEQLIENKIRNNTKTLSKQPKNDIIQLQSLEINQEKLFKDRLQKCNIQPVCLKKQKPNNDKPLGLNIFQNKQQFLAKIQSVMNNHLKKKEAKQRVIPQIQQNKHIRYQHTYQHNIANPIKVYYDSTKHAQHRQNFNQFEIYSNQLNSSIYDILKPQRKKLRRSRTLPIQIKNFTNQRLFLDQNTKRDFRKQKKNYIIPQLQKQEKKLKQQKRYTLKNNNLRSKVYRPSPQNYNKFIGNELKQNLIYFPNYRDNSYNYNYIRSNRPSYNPYPFKQHYLISDINNNTFQLRYNNQHIRNMYNLNKPFNHTNHCLYKNRYCVPCKENIKVYECKKCEFHCPKI